jgi:hypothetical protein
MSNTHSAVRIVGMLVACAGPCSAWSDDYGRQGWPVDVIPPIVLQILFTGETNSSAIVMPTSDFRNFADASAFGYASPIMTPLEPKVQNQCTHGIDSLFDDNYSAPGSVFPDPAAAGGVCLGRLRFAAALRGGGVPVAKTDE